MKKYYILALAALATFCQMGYAQTNTTAKSEYTEIPVTQLNHKVTIRAFKENACYKDMFQWGEIKVKNLTDGNMYIEFEAYVKTECGTEITKKFGAYVRPDNTDMAVVRVEPEDCLGKLVEKTGSIFGSMDDVYNRITAVGYRNLKLTPYPAYSDTPPSTTGAITPKPGVTGNTNASSKSTIPTNNSKSSYTPPPKSTETLRKETVMTNMNTEMKGNEKTYQAVVSGLNDMSDLLQQQQQRRAAELAAKKQQREEERQAKEAERKEEAEKANEYVEALARQSAANEHYKQSQQNIDLQILAGLLGLKRPAGFSDTTKQVYYLTYQRNFATGKVIIHTYTLHKYSDGTWMLLPDLKEKLHFEEFLTVDGSTRLLGAYDKKEADRAIAQIVAKTNNASVDKSFINLNGTAANIAGGTDKNFWNN